MPKAKTIEDTSITRDAENIVGQKEIYRKSSLV